jgi:hypothetical protein
MFADESPNGRHQIRGNRHGRIGRALESSLILGYRLFVRLALVVLQDMAHSGFVPSLEGIYRSSSCPLPFATAIERLFRFGVRSYAVITNTESVSESGT